MMRRFLAAICILCVLALGAWLLAGPSQHRRDCDQLASELAKARQEGLLQQVVTLQTLLSARNC